METVSSVLHFLSNRNEKKKESKSNQNQTKPKMYKIHKQKLVIRIFMVETYHCTQLGTLDSPIQRRHVSVWGVEKIRLSRKWSDRLDVGIVNYDNTYVVMSMNVSHGWWRTATSSLIVFDITASA